jgi:hypothetical protein
VEQSKGARPTAVWRRPARLRLVGSGVGKGVALRRLGNAAMCGWPEGNNSGGRVWGWWSIALNAGRLYMAVRCSGCDREFGGGLGGATYWRNGGGNGSTVGRQVEDEERRLHGGGWVPYIAARGGGRRLARQRNRGWGNSGVEAMGAARRRRPLSEDSRHGLGTVRSVRLTAWALMVFLLSPNYPNLLKFKNQNGCLNLLEKFPNFACG